MAEQAQCTGGAGMTAAELQAIGERAAKAPAGPWPCYNGYDIPDTDMVAVERFGNPANANIIFAHEEDPKARKADWEFIACARADIPALVAEVRRLKAALLCLPHE